MYIERGIYDWQQTATIVTMIYTAAPGRKKRMDPESINPYLQIKRHFKETRKRISLSALGRLIPGVRVIDQRSQPTENPTESRSCK